MIRILSDNLISILQTAIGPVILISGIGLLLLTMTNRLGRAIDRARSLASIKYSGDARTEHQLKILWQRSKLLRLSILCASTSALLAGILVITLFISALLQLSMEWLISGLFVSCILSLCLSIVIFIRDINLSLEALRYVLHDRNNG